MHDLRGGSALTPAPVEGIRLADKQETTRRLLACGATIHEINAIRKHLSRIKGGQLCRRANGARVVSLILSSTIQGEAREVAKVLSAGTDGSDGPTDAAGAFADGSSVSRGNGLGLSAYAHLAGNDAYRFFHPLDDLFITGPTRTNVMDLQVLLIDTRSIQANCGAQNAAPSGVMNKTASMAKGCLAVFGARILPSVLLSSAVTFVPSGISRSDQFPSGNKQLQVVTVADLAPWPAGSRCNQAYLYETSCLSSFPNDQSGRPAAGGGAYG